MEAELIAAAILTAGFCAAERQHLHSGRLDDSIREKFLEYVAFVREQIPAKKNSPRRRTGR